MRAAFLGLVLAASNATHGLANEITIDKRSDFEAIVLGKELRAVGVRLEVLKNGAITGHAYGQPVTGSWSWTGNYFCRELSLGAVKRLPMDCSMVTVDDKKITFIGDRGRGQSAWLRLD